MVNQTVADALAVVQNDKDDSDSKDEDKVVKDAAAVKADSDAFDAQVKLAKDVKNLLDVIVSTYGQPAQS